MQITNVQFEIHANEMLWTLYSSFEAYVNVPLDAIITALRLFLCISITVRKLKSIRK